MKIIKRPDKIIIYPGLSFLGTLLFFELFVTVGMIISAYRGTLGIAGILFVLLIYAMGHLWTRKVVIIGDEIKITSFFLPILRKTFHFGDVDYVYVEGNSTHYVVSFVLKNMKKYYFCSTYLGGDRVMALSREVAKIVKCNKVKEQ